MQKSDGGGEEFESAIAFGSWRELALEGRGTGGRVCMQAAEVGSHAAMPGLARCAATSD